MKDLCKVQQQWWLNGNEPNNHVVMDLNPAFSSVSNSKLCIIERAPSGDEIQQILKGKLFTVQLATTGS